MPDIDGTLVPHQWNNTGEKRLAGILLSLSPPSSFISHPLLIPDLQLQSIKMSDEQT
jgi:hypothetical protein